MAKDDIKKHQFKTGTQWKGNAKGRPRKLLSSINKELHAQGYERVTSSQVAEAYELLFNLPETHIKKLADNKEMPYFFRLVAKEMLSKNGREMIERMLDRAHGRSKQLMELGGQNGEPLPQPIIVINSPQNKTQWKSKQNLM